MAESSAEDRTEDPTAKRLEDARKKGQVVRSRELNTLLSLLGGPGASEEKSLPDGFSRTMGCHQPLGKDTICPGTSASSA